jgi:hypothetical protein
MKKEPVRYQSSNWKPPACATLVTVHALPCYTSTCLYSEATHTGVSGALPELRAIKHTSTGLLYALNFQAGYVTDPKLCVTTAGGIASKGLGWRIRLFRNFMLPSFVVTNWVPCLYDFVSSSSEGRRNGVPKGTFRVPKGTFRNLASHMLGRAHRYPPKTPFYIFFQQIYIQNILNMLHTLRFFHFKMPFIS